MEKLIARYVVMQQALETFRKVLKMIEERHKDSDSELAHVLESGEVSRIFRDSSIQRFEYCVDLLWKYLKDYLEIVLQIVPEIKSPKNIIRTCCEARVLTEQESQEAISMIESRNMSSLSYREEIAEIIAKQLSDYYSLIKTILEKTKPA
jgi:nucleotidyltransferase substrate binding protein (TIGR01987 family)